MAYVFIATLGSVAGVAFQGIVPSEIFLSLVGAACVYKATPDMLIVEKFFTGALIGSLIGIGGRVNTLALTLLATCGLAFAAERFIGSQTEGLGALIGLATATATARWALKNKQITQLKRANVSLGLFTGIFLSVASKVLPTTLPLMVPGMGSILTAAAAIFFK